MLVRPSAAGVLVNSATVATTSLVANPNDNTASISVPVLSASADLALGLLGAPNPVVLGGNVTYTLIVTNLGAATAAAVTITNTLPAGLSFVTASPAGYVVNGSVVTFTNLGDLGSGGQVSASIVAQTLVAGTTTNTATCGSVLPTRSRLIPLPSRSSWKVRLVCFPERRNGDRCLAGGCLELCFGSADGLQAPITWTE